MVFTLREIATKKKLIRLLFDRIQEKIGITYQDIEFVLSKALSAIGDFAHAWRRSAVELQNQRLGNTGDIPPMLELFIANKNYSSWSLRPWIQMRKLEIPFIEKLVPFAESDQTNLVYALGPAIYAFVSIIGIFRLPWAVYCLGFACYANCERKPSQFNQTPHLDWRKR